MSNCHAADYPVKKGDLHFTPIIRVTKTGRRKIITPDKLRHGEIGFLLVDIPNGRRVANITVEEALGMAADVAMM